MSGFTPGPWRLSGTQPRWSDPGQGAVVADEPTGHDDVENLAAYGGHLVAESIARAANARLIAAAPDLLAACEAVCLWFDVDSTEFNRDMAVAAARAAIAKATVSP